MDLYDDRMRSFHLFFVSLPYFSLFLWKTRKEEIERRSGRFTKLGARSQLARRTGRSRGRLRSIPTSYTGILQTQWDLYVPFLYGIVGDRVALKRSRVVRIQGVIKTNRKVRN